MNRRVLTLGLLTAACNSQWECVEVDSDCTPLYEPTFDNVYEQTLQRSCAVGGGSCHEASGQQGGLAFDDPDEAYHGLLNTSVEHLRVLPSDAECSLLMIRLEQEDPDDAMPPGAPLDATERCAVQQWIEAGAPR